MVGGKGISIWFFIGSLLLIYGVVITIANVVDLISPNTGHQPVLSELHFGVWWGIVLIIIGAVYFICFRPWKKKEK
jgi:hypothetical protein